jgi:hypothetical protein
MEPLYFGGIEMKKLFAILTLVLFIFPLIPSSGVQSMSPVPAYNEEDEWEYERGKIMLPHDELLDAYGLYDETSETQISRKEFFEYVLDNATIRPWEDHKDYGPNATDNEILRYLIFNPDHIERGVKPEDLGLEVKESSKYANDPVASYLPDPAESLAKPKEIGFYEHVGKEFDEKGWSMFPETYANFDYYKEDMLKSALTEVAMFVAAPYISPPVLLLVNIGLFLGDLYSQYNNSESTETVAPPAPEPTPAPKPQPAAQAPKPYTGPEPGTREYLEAFNAQHGTGGPAISLEEFMGTTGSGSSGGSGGGSGGGSDGGGHVWAKPVLYLYPEKTISITVTIDTLGEIFESIPDYGSGWAVTVEPSGLIDGVYDYLFYEIDIDYDFSKEVGWVFTREQFAFEMTKVLYDLGLRGAEIEEFIEFWDDTLRKDTNYYAVYLMLPEEVEEAAKLNFSTNPDSMLRVHFIFEPVPNPIPLKSPNFETFIRKGFTVVEWGGLMIE